MSRSFCAADTKIFAISDLIFSPRPKDEALWNASLIFFKWALILSFAVPPYIYAYSLTAFFENYGTAFSILTNLFGEGEYNKHIPKMDGMFGAIISLSFSLFGYNA